MIYLFLSIIFNTILFVVFNFYKQFRINTLHAIVVNYFTAALLGFIILKQPLSFAAIINKPWFWYAAFLGFNFISIFYVLGLTTQKMGVSVASVVSKMSVVIPVLMAFTLFKEAITILKIIGITMALIAVFYATKKENGASISNKYIYLPILLFIGSGVLDALLKYTSVYHIPNNTEMALFSSTIFLIAGVYGVIFLTGKYFVKKNKIESKNIVAGICLGIPNYFSLYFLLKAIDLPQLDSSIIFPINNVGVVVLSSLVGLWLFKEQLSLKNWLGITLAVLSILLMSAIQ